MKMVLGAMWELVPSKKSCKAIDARLVRWWNEMEIRTAFQEKQDKMLTKLGMSATEVVEWRWITKGQRNHEQRPKVPQGVFFSSHGGEGGDGLSSQGVPSEPSKLVSQCFLSLRHCVLGITPQWMLSSANYRPQWVPYRLLQPHTLVALPWGQATQVGEGQHVSLDQPPFCTLPSVAGHRQVGGL